MSHQFAQEIEVTSHEGHRFNSRNEVLDAIIEHSGNTHSETGEWVYSPLELEGMTNVQLVGWLSDLFSVPMELKGRFK